MLRDMSGFLTARAAAFRAAMPRESQLLTGEAGQALLVETCNRVLDKDEWTIEDMTVLSAIGFYMAVAATKESSK